MPQRLHLVFGGELVDPARSEVRDVNDIHIVGTFPVSASAHDAWTAEAQRTVDNAHTRYILTQGVRRRDEAQNVSSTEELG